MREYKNRASFYPRPKKPLKDHTDAELARLNEAYDYYSNADAIDGIPPKMTKADLKWSDRITRETERRLKRK